MAWPKAARLGKKHSDITKQKIRIKSLKQFKNGMPKSTRKKMSDAHKKLGTIPPSWKGKKRSLITRKKMSDARRGKKHYRWDPDRKKILSNQKQRSSIENKKWRAQILKRDKKCKFKNENCSGILIAHHIKSWSKFPKLRYIISNGIILCEFHHNQIHGRSTK